MKLKFSSIDQPELVAYLALLGLRSGCPEGLEVEEVIEHGAATLCTATTVIVDGKYIAMELAGLSRAAFAKIDKDSEPSLYAKYEQVFSFAYGTAAPCLRSGRPDPNVAVYEVVNGMLEKSAFLCGNSPSTADALLYSLLYSRVKAFVPMLVQRHFRVVRWFLQFQHDCVRGSAAAVAALPLVAVEYPDAKAAVSLPLKEMAGLKLDGSAGKKEKPKKEPKPAAAAAPAPALDLVAIGRVDLRVGRIVEIDKHPNADRLYIEKVDVGEAELRTVVSGLVQDVPIDELRDRLCVFVCNLKPASLCKVTSQAMILVGKNDERLQVLVVPEGAQPGDRVGIDGITEQPDAQIKPAKDGQLSIWDEARKDLCVDGEGRALWQDKPLIVKGNSVGPANIVHSTTVTNGIIS